MPLYRPGKRGLLLPQSRTSQARRSNVRLDPRDPINNGLIGCWLLNGPILTDLSGSNNVASFSGSPGMVDGRAGPALTFSHANYVNLGSGAVAQQGQKYAIAAWVYFTGGASDYAILGDSFGTGPGYEFRVSSSGTSLVLLQQDTHSIASATITNITNAWAHVGVAYDAVGGGYQFYCNGTQVGSGTSAGFGGSPHNVWLGQAGNAEDFSGSICQLRIYNRIPSPAEFSRLATTPNGNLGLLAPVRRRVGVSGGPVNQSGASTISATATIKSASTASMVGASKLSATATIKSASKEAMLGAALVSATGALKSATKDAMVAGSLIGSTAAIVTNETSNLAAFASTIPATFGITTNEGKGLTASATIFATGSVVAGVGANMAAAATVAGGNSFVVSATTGGHTKKKTEYIYFARHRNRR